MLLFILEICELTIIYIIDASVACFNFQHRKLSKGKNGILIKNLNKNIPIYRYFEIRSGKNIHLLSES